MAAVRDSRPCPRSWRASARDFPVLARRINGHPLAYLDNAASTQQPARRHRRGRRLLRRAHHANVHRGVHTLSQEATALYEGAREKVRRFVNAASTARNRLRARHDGGDQPRRAVLRQAAPCARRRDRRHRDSSTIRTSCPGRCSAQQTGAVLRVVPIDRRGDRRFRRLPRHARPAHAHRRARPRLERARHGAAGRRLHRRGPRARASRRWSTARRPCRTCRVDVQALGCDFYAFSGHKMYGPTGIGVLYGRESLLDGDAALAGRRRHDPVGVVRRARPTTTCRTASRPARRTSPAPSGSARRSTTSARSASTAIAAHEQSLLEYATREARRHSTGSRSSARHRTRRASCRSPIEGIHPHDLGTVLDSQGVAVRTGHHCAMPVMEFFGVPATTRASFGLYNTRAEIDALREAVLHAIRMLR